MAPGFPSTSEDTCLPPFDGLGIEVSAFAAADLDVGVTGRFQAGLDLVRRQVRGSRDADRRQADTGDDELDENVFHSFLETVAWPYVNCDSIYPIRFRLNSYLRARRGMVGKRLPKRAARSATSDSRLS